MVVLSTRRGDRRVAGADLRRVLAHPAGGAARLQPAGDHRAHLQDRDGPDLHPGGELGALARVPGAGDRVPELDQPGGRLRHRGHRHDDHHDAAVPHRRARPWGWPRPGAWALTSLLARPWTCAFFAANLVKIPQGGWFPLVVALGIYTLMTTWKRGRARLAAIVRENTLPMDLFLADIEPAEAAPGAGHRGLPDLRLRAARRRCCCTISSTTRCCTRR